MKEANQVGERLIDGMIISKWSSRKWIWLCELNRSYYFSLMSGADPVPENKCFLFFVIFKTPDNGQSLRSR